MAITLPNASTSFGQAGAGTFVDSSRRDVISRTINYTGVSFGWPCFEAGGDRVATALAVGPFLGIALADDGSTPIPDTLGGAININGDLAGHDQPARDFYPDRSTVSIAASGVVRVLASSAVTRGAQAYVTPGGALVATASGNTAIPASFDDDAAAGSIVPLRIVRD